MIEFHEALKIIQENVKSLEIEVISLENSMGRVLAEDVVSDVNIPPFDKAAMDGFACRKEDLPGPFKIVDEIPAGKFPLHEIERGECARIMTGAPVPDGADTVFMIEHHVLLEKGLVLFTAQKTSSNICYKGEDVKSGDVVLTTGTWINPQEIAVLAGAGKTKVKVFEQPVVGVLSTGSELVEPKTMPGDGKIRNSNGLQMVAQLAGMRIPSRYFGIVADDKTQLKQKIEKIISDIDVLFISGGVSVGDYDFVPDVLTEMGFEILFTAMATKPGKHNIFARKGDKYVLGFPGNPVSSFIQFKLVGRALLLKMMGRVADETRFRVEMTDGYKRKNSNRLEFVPVIINGAGAATLIPYNGSAHVHALSKANALMEVPVGINSIEKGDLVYVRPL